MSLCSLNTKYFLAPSKKIKKALIYKYIVEYNSVMISGHQHYSCPIGVETLGL